ncbi:MAG: GTPase HflX [Flavobacteriales bacterium]|jgi:GTP-binding protein HflX|uniref:GTPase HflX n=1 Tax=uncultured Flavobacteriia bacterium TaxID=212695 RepID=H6RGG8_9BACT|nr:GTP-binding protein HflX [uncultured bacterium]CCG00129.1 GTP-binding proten [uncultured Flavobacteriia bacterium]|tara:strand:- start:173 stop:1351 length:1179 start_codon:yes stop_codon:yes gene_type:complete
MAKRQPVSTSEEKETCVLIGLATQNQKREQLEEYLEELAFLVVTANAISKKTFIQSLTKPDSKTFIGSGKLLEIRDYVKAEGIDMIVFDDELSGSQIRNIEKEIEGVKIIDRPNLILDIFAQRARTSHARTQVELAQYQYLLPRLTNMWTHLQKQKGGIGMKGPGEKEIETDRRIIRDRIALLKKELVAIDKQMATQRSNRGSMIRVALVGYTNAGKSTLMTALSKSDVFAENKLFATLDTTVRKVVVANLPFLLSDTVGFIRKLPTQLIESFKSTLDETRESDLLIHVIDVSHPQFEDQVAVVERTLEEIGSDDKPTLLLFNKIDLLEDEDAEVSGAEIIEGLKQRFEKDGFDVVFMSARDKEDITNLRDLLYNRVKELHVKRYPYHKFLY